MTSSRRCSTSNASSPGLPGVGRQHDDAVVVVAEPELLRGADHAGGDVTVGLAGADLEAAGEDAAGQDDDDEVTVGEVPGTADDALRLAGAVRVPDVDLAPADRLAVLLGLLDSKDSTRPTTSGPWMPPPATSSASSLRPSAVSRAASCSRGHVLGQVDVLAEPGDRRRSSDLRSEGRGEADVALEEVPQVLDAVAEHQGPVDAHAEGEAGVAVGVDAAGDEHPRVHDTAAAPLDPPLAAAGPAVRDAWSRHGTRSRPGPPRRSAR